MVEHDLKKEIRVSSLESWEFSLRHFVEHVGGCWWRTKGRDDDMPLRNLKESLLKEVERSITWRSCMLLSALDSITML